MSNIFFNCLNNLVEKHKKKFKREKCSSSPGPFQSQNSHFTDIDFSENINLFCKNQSFQKCYLKMLLVQKNVSFFTGLPIKD